MDRNGDFFIDGATKMAQQIVELRVRLIALEKDLREIIDTREKVREEVQALTATMNSIKNVAIGLIAALVISEFGVLQVLKAIFLP